MIDGHIQRRELLRVLGGVVGAQTGIQGASVQKRKIVEKALANFSDPLKRDQYFELYSPEIVLHGYDGVDPGIESVKRYYASFWEAFPDACITANDIIEAQDKVVVRFSVTGTHRGRILGIDGSGKAIQLAGMTILRFQGQKCVERWSVTNSLALAAQLGAFPPK
jgi:predicted ester cyclase